MKLFHDARFLRIARPLLTTLALGGGIWHTTHAIAAWRQMERWKTSDPSASDFYWSALQMEIGVTVAALAAAVFAWQVFDVRRVKPQA